MRHGFAGASREQRQRAVTVIGGHSVGRRIKRRSNRQTQRAKPQYALAGKLQRLLTGRQQRQLRSRAQQRQRHCGDLCYQMLAVVEYDEHPAISDARCEIIGAGLGVKRNAQRPRQTAQQQAAVADRCQLYEPHAIGIVRPVLAGSKCCGLGKPGFAQAAGAGDGDEPLWWRGLLPLQHGRERSHFVITTKQRRQRCRQIAGGSSDNRLRGSRRNGGPCTLVVAIRHRIRLRR